MFFEEMLLFVFVIFKQKTAYELRIRDWSSDVCSSDLKFAFRSLSEEIETVTPTGQMFFHMVDAFVRFERDVMAERSIAALAEPTGAPRQRGRPPTISDEQWSMARKLMAAEPPLSVAGPAKLLAIGSASCRGRVCRYG